MRRILKRVLSVILLNSMLLGTMSGVPVRAETEAQLQKITLKELNITNEVKLVTSTVTDSGVTFQHPGVGATASELENVRKQLKNGNEPWKAYMEGWLKTDYASKDYKIRNQHETMPGMAKYTYKNYTSGFMEYTIQPDAMTAYIQSLLYYFTGDYDYREKAITIIRLWSQLDPRLAGDVADGKIKMSGPMYYMVNAAEILKATNDSCTRAELLWTEQDNANFIKNYIEPPMKYYLAPEASVDYFFNQYSYALSARMAADIFMNDGEDYAVAVEMATVDEKKTTWWAGSLDNVFRKMNEDPYDKSYKKLDDDAIQIVEMGRDQPHAAGNISCLTRIGYMMESQGTKVSNKDGRISDGKNAVSFFQFRDYRLLRGMNYYAKYNLGYDVPWYPASKGRMDEKLAYDVLYDQARGRFYGYDVLYYYYMNDKQIKDKLTDEKIGKYLIEVWEKQPSPEHGRYVGSDYADFWLHIPKNAKGKVNALRGESVEKHEIENRYTLLSGKAVRKNKKANKGAYLEASATPKGTDLAILYIPNERNRSEYSDYRFVVKTHSTATMELRRNNHSEPFHRITLPNTKGKWKEVSVNMNINYVTYSQYPQDIQILFVKVTGKKGQKVGLDSLQVNNTENYAPVFENSITEKEMVTYVGAGNTWQWKAADENGDKLRYELEQAPEGVRIDKKTGKITWKPKKQEKTTFYVQVHDGKAVTLLTVHATVKEDLNKAIREIKRGYDKNETYTSSTLQGYRQAYQALKQTHGNGVNRKLAAFKEAVERLEPLTSYCEDGSIEYRHMVTSDLSSGMERNLLDHDTETFTGDLRPKDGHDPQFIMDFGEHYQIRATSFRIQARKYFPTRVKGIVIYGSNDAENWTQLTKNTVESAEEMETLKVYEECKDSSYRYLKISASCNPLNLAELRIYGERVEGK